LNIYITQNYEQNIIIQRKFVKNKVMQKFLVLMCYHLGIWGFLGFIATLAIGFIACCTNISKPVYFILLGSFAAVGITASIICAARRCKEK
jgi:hypothetical protein